MAVNAVQNLNLQTQGGSSSDFTQVLDLQPTTVSLGTVTGVSAVSGTATFYNENGFWETGFSDVSLDSLSDDAFTALTSLSSGDTVTLGPWASNNGHPTYVIFDSYYGDAGYFSLYFSDTAPNYRSHAFGSPPSAYFSVVGNNTEVTTDNSSLALSQTYFEIGDLTPFVTADVTVSGNAITLAGDLSSSISAGMTVVEKSYASGPNVLQYNLQTGGWVDYAQTSVWGSPTTLSATHYGNNGMQIYSANDYVFGSTLIQIPSEWNDWIIQVNATAGVSMTNMTGTTSMFAELQCIANPTVFNPGELLTISESNRHAMKSTSITIWSASLLGGLSLLLDKVFYNDSTTSNYKQISLTGIANKPKLEQAYPIEDITEVGVFVVLDPRFQQGSIDRPTISVTAIRTG
jgi:hypothetical protein